MTSGKIFVWRMVMDPSSGLNYIVEPQLPGLISGYLPVEKTVDIVRQVKTINPDYELVLNNNSNGPVENKLTTEYEKSFSEFL